MSSYQADQTNKAFFQASKHKESAPIINIYERDTKTVQLRAATENSDIIQPSAIDIHGNSLFQSEKKVIDQNTQKIRPGLEPYTQSLIPKESSSSPIGSKKTKEERQKEKEELKLLNQSIESQTTSKSYDQYAERMSSMTRDVVLKSQMILQETEKLTKKHKKQQKKKNKDHDFFCSEEGTPTLLPSVHQPPPSSFFSSDEGVEVPYQTVVVSGSKSMTASSSLPKLENSSSRKNLQNSENIQSTFDQRKPSRNRYIPSDLDEDEREGYLNKFDWENLLARHILSVYATSHSQTNQSETRAVMELLEEPSSPPSSSLSSRLKKKSTAISSPSSSSRKTSIMKTNELKQIGLFQNLDKERVTVEKKSIRPGVTSRSTIMMLGKTATLNPLAISTGELMLSKRGNTGSPSRPSTTTSATTKAGGKAAGKTKGIQSKRSRSPKDPIEDIGSKSLEKLKHSDRKQRNEIKTTTQTNGMTSVIRAPAKCFPIWFYSSGDVYGEWVLLPNGARLQSALDALMEKKNYLKYSEIVGSVLDDCWIEKMMIAERQEQQVQTKGRGSSIDSKIRMNEPIDDLTSSSIPSSLTIKELQSLCRQYLLICNAFATLCLENKEYSTAMILIRTAEEWLKREDIFDNLLERLELKAFIHTTFAFYFHKKKMTSAALSHSQQALEIHRKLKKDDYIAMCLLMISCCKYQVSNFKEAHRVTHLISTYLIPSSTSDFVDLVSNLRDGGRGKISIP